MTLVGAMAVYLRFGYLHFLKVLSKAESNIKVDGLEMEMDWIRKSVVANSLIGLLH